MENALALTNVLASLDGFWMNLVFVVRPNVINRV